MKKFIFVVFMSLLSFRVAAENLDVAVDRLEKDWALAYYSNSSDPSAKYAQLLKKAIQLAGDFPGKAEPILWQAIILASDADHQTPVQALEQITKARDLLVQAINIEPNGVNGAAHVVLGSLYYLSPPWPVAFGDNDKAKALLTQALKIAPHSIDANYFYGDFLLTQNEVEQAQIYFKRATESPARKNQLFADESLKHKAAAALANAATKKSSTAKEDSLSFFNSVSAN